MRILAITSLYPNPFEEQRGPFNRQQIAELARGHELRVIAPIAWTTELRRRWQAGSPLAQSRCRVVDEVPVEHPRFLFAPKVLRGWHGQAYLRSIRQAFWRAVRSFRPELVYAPWAYPDGWAGATLARQAGLPVVIKVHGSDILLLDSYPSRRAGTIEALRLADRVIAVSADLRAKTHALGIATTKLQVIYDGVNHGLFAPGPQAEARAKLGLDAQRPMVLFVGNLVPVKGVDRLIEAFALLAPQSDAVCYLVGDGPRRQASLRQIARAGLADRIRLVGSRPHAELATWYRAADVLVLPSYSEGVPNVLLEAAACGTPFVASAVGGVPEISHLGPSTLVPSGDVDALAGAIARWLRGPRSQASSACRVRDVADTVREIEACFSAVVAESRSAAATQAEVRVSNP